VSVPGLRAFQRAYPCAQTRGVEKRLFSGPIGEVLQILADPYLRMLLPAFELARSQALARRSKRAEQASSALACILGY
jgi:hypothetical protein